MKAETVLNQLEVHRAWGRPGGGGLCLFLPFCEKCQVLPSQKPLYGTHEGSVGKSLGKGPRGGQERCQVVGKLPEPTLPGFLLGKGDQVPLGTLLRAQKLSAERLAPSSGGLEKETISFSSSPPRNPTLASKPLASNFEIHLQNRVHGDRLSSLTANLHLCAHR